MLRRHLVRLGSAGGQRGGLNVDTSVPALLLAVGSYPVHHGSVAAVRSLGRLGVPVFAITKDRFTPTASSRYLRRSLRWPTTGGEDLEVLVSGLLAISERIGARAVLIPTDDEAALLSAQHADVLGRRFMLPAIAPDLPRQLASKRSLAHLCAEFDVPAPRFGAPTSVRELRELARAIGFPVVLKNDEAWARLTNPAVDSTTLVANMAELHRLASRWRSMPSLIVQEYLPRGHSEDWIVHGYFGERIEILFTGVKLRSWPPHAGVTAVADPRWNAELAAQTAAFCRAVGFRGIADLDWRLDTRDGRFRLLDFNPRVGAQFQMFETDAGVDVVRALHLDLTGRDVPEGRQVDRNRFVVEHLAVPAAVAYRLDPHGTGALPAVPPGGSRRAWIAADDPLPALMVAPRIAGPAAWRLLTAARRAL